MARQGTRHAAFRTTAEAQAPESRVLDEKFWLRHGGESDPSMRTKILLVTVDDIARVGPAAFNVGVLCSALGISNSLINHHFGGRDELISEAVVFAYERYVEALWLTARVKKTPESRLRAWIEKSIELQVEMQGLAAVLNYPTASLDVTNHIHEKFGDIMADLGALNMARLIQLVGDVRKNKISEREISLTSIARKDLINNPVITVVAASIGWSVLGVSVWKTGPHLPTARAPETSLLLKTVTKYHIDRLIDEAKGK